MFLLQEGNMRQDAIALFDMDGTLCDYEKKLISDLNEIRSSNEDEVTSVPRDDAPLYLRKRANLIRSSTEWWATLPQFRLGFDVWHLALQIGYRRMILTQGPKRNPNAWSGKKIWLDNNVGNEVDVTITRDKGLVYGKVLVDDWPEYIEQWLEWRPRGLVIMPASKANVNFKHKQVIRYDGDNFAEVSNAMRKILEVNLD